MTALYICNIVIHATKILRPSERKKVVVSFPHSKIPIRLDSNTERIAPEDFERYMEKYTKLDFRKYTFEYELSEIKFSSKIMQNF